MSSVDLIFHSCENRHMDETPTDETIARKLALAEVKRSPATEKKVAKLDTVVVEERQFGVSGEAREDFARLYDLEIKRLGYCPLDKIAHRSKKTYGLQCRVPLGTFQEWLVHHQLHLMTQADSRVQKQTNSDSRELVYPTSEKTMRAALGPDERKRMLQDPEMRARLLKRRELSS